MKFTWSDPDADTVAFRYYYAGTEKLIQEEKVSRASFGGFYEIKPPASLPSGVRSEIRIVFLKMGHETQRYPHIFYYETERQHLEYVSESYTEKIGLFKKRTYYRLRINNHNGLNGRLGVRNVTNGCICAEISWTDDGNDCVSEPLPEGETWIPANRPDTPYVYDI